MKKLLLFLALVLAPVSAWGQTTTTMYRVDTIAALKAIPTSRPPVVIVVDADAQFSWSTTPCTVADDVYEVTPTSGPTGCWSRMASAPAVGKVAAAGNLNAVANQTALKALSLTGLTAGTRVYRAGYTDAGDGGAATYALSLSACSLASGAGDNGSQVAPNSGTGCWLLTLSTFEPSIKIWGAYGLNAAVDDGPPIRAACAYAESVGVTISVPKGNYYLNTLDTSGLGALVLNPAGTAGQGCNVKGDFSSDYPDDSGTGPRFVLGTGLNRPLLYVRTSTYSPLWEKIALEGNMGLQSGWAGGPGGKLYTVQVEDDLSGLGGSKSIRMDRVVMTGGYNGNIYVGAGRGGFWSRDTWSQYSGQTTSDYSVYMQGFDSVFLNFAVGSNSGNGIILASGAQYQFTNGAIFLNGAAGLVVNGDKVQYLAMDGTNIQANDCGGIVEATSAPFAGTNGGGHVYSNVTFDANSQATTNTCSDVLVEGSTIVRLVNPIFMGRSNTTWGLPKYNVETSGGPNLVYVTNATTGSGTHFGTAFTNDETVLIGNNIPVSGVSVNMSNPVGVGTAPTATQSFFANNTRALYGSRDSTSGAGVYFGAVNPNEARLWTTTSTALTFGINGAEVGRFNSSGQFSATIVGGSPIASGGTFQAGSIAYSDASNFGMLMRPLVAGSVYAWGVTKSDGSANLITITNAGLVSIPGTFQLTQASPAAADACTAGQIAADTNYLYTCSASGAWKRVAVTGGY